MKRKSLGMSVMMRTIIYTVCIFLSIISIFPFYTMFINATRGTYEIQSSSIALIPSTYTLSNWKVLINKNFNPLIGFVNSMIVSCGATILGVYFSSLTAYGLVAYQWKWRQPFFTFIMAVLMIPAQVSIIGFFQFMYRIGLINNFIPLIVPAMASPAMVFFMRQYLLGTLSMDIVNCARIDGSGEFRTFNQIILPIMQPALATQAIFSFVASWNNLFMPLVLLTDRTKYTMPIMVNLLRGDIYRTEYGSVYLALSLTVLPLFIVYFLLSRYIISGVALGALKE